MKILLVSSFLDDGGAEKWMLDTIKNMDRTGVEIDYYFWCDIKIDTFVKDYESLGVNLYFRKLNEKFGKSMIWLWHDFKKFIKNHGPYDAVHVNGNRIYQQMVLMTVSKKMKIPVRMVHSHNSKSGDFHGFKKILRKICRSKTIKNATTVGGCSQLATVAKYGDKILNNNKYYIFKNGISYKKFSDCTKQHNHFRNELNLGNGPIFLHIGRFNAQKNHIFLINIFNEILKINKDAKLILIGHGEDQAKVFDFINKLNIEKNIIYIPYTSETEKYYSAADVFLLPSLYEGLPIVLLEAQASGIPCVFSNTITDEVLINDNLRVLSLNDTYYNWAKAAYSLIDCRCDKAQENIYNAGYDAELTAASFLNCCKGRCINV